MDEFVRLFLTGEALQDMLARFCDDSSSRDGTYTICKKMSAMCKTPVCVRLTPVGVAPFKNNISMVYHYKWMTDTQKDYVLGILNSIHITASCSLLREHRVQGIGLAGEVVVVTWMDGEKMWGVSEELAIKLKAVDVLKALVSCVWRTPDLTSELKRGICNINIQMAVHELALTRNALACIEDHVSALEKQTA